MFITKFYSFHSIENCDKYIITFLNAKLTNAPNIYKKPKSLSKSTPTITIDAFLSKLIYRKKMFKC